MMRREDIRRRTGLSLRALAALAGLPPTRVTEALKYTPADSPNRRTIGAIVAAWELLDDEGRARYAAALEADRSAVLAEITQADQDQDAPQQADD